MRRENVIAKQAENPVPVGRGFMVVSPREKEGQDPDDDVDLLWTELGSLQQKVDEILKILKAILREGVFVKEGIYIK